MNDKPIVDSRDAEIEALRAEVERLRAGYDPDTSHVAPLVADLRVWALSLPDDERSAALESLLTRAANELHNLAWALSIPGFDRMATDEEEAAHQEGMAKVRETLDRMAAAKAEHEAMRNDAARYRWLREEFGHHMLESFLCVYGVNRWDKIPPAVDAAIDEAIKESQP